MIGIILPTHTHDPSSLMASVAEAGLVVRWYIFHHSDNEQLESALKLFAANNDVHLYLYRVNRGLARSWNEGIYQSVEDRCEITLVLNDDLHFRSGGLRVFIDHLRADMSFGLGFVHGLEVGGALDGQVIVQGMACFAIGRSCLDKIGYFDENFIPAYYEDMDYLRRMRLAGCSQTIVPGVIAEHHRSSTLRASALLTKSMSHWHKRNQNYYERKWGMLGHEIHTVPFGNANFGLKIDWPDRHMPYGKEYDFRF